MRQSGNRSPRHSNKQHHFEEIRCRPFVLCNRLYLIQQNRISDASKPYKNKASGGFSETVALDSDAGFREDGIPSGKFWWRRARARSVWIGSRVQRESL